MTKPAGKITGKELAADICAGMDHYALMEKYDLSVDQLDDYFKILLEKGLLTKAELANRGLPTLQSDSVHHVSKPDRFFREMLIREAFEDAHKCLEAKRPSEDGEWDSWPFMAFILIPVGFQAIGWATSRTPESALIREYQSAAMWIWGIGMAGLCIYCWWTGEARFIRSRVLPSLYRTLRPLNPTIEELEDGLNALGSVSEALARRLVPQSVMAGLNSHWRVTLTRDALPNTPGLPNQIEDLEAIHRMRLIRAKFDLAKPYDLIYRGNPKILAAVIFVVGAAVAIYVASPVWEHSTIRDYPGVAVLIAIVGGISAYAYSAAVRSRRVIQSRVLPFLCSCLSDLNPTPEEIASVLCDHPWFRGQVSLQSILEGLALVDAPIPSVTKRELLIEDIFYNAVQRLDIWRMNHPDPSINFRSMTALTITTVIPFVMLFISEALEGSRIQDYTYMAIALYVIAGAAVSVYFLIEGDSTSFVYSNVLPGLCKALKPLNPSREEIDSALRHWYWLREVLPARSLMKALETCDTVQPRKSGGFPALMPANQGGKRTVDRAPEKNFRRRRLIVIGTTAVVGMAVAIYLTYPGGGDQRSPVDPDLGQVKVTNHLGKEVTFALITESNNETVAVYRNLPIGETLIISNVPKDRYRLEYTIGKTLNEANDVANPDATWSRFPQLVEFPAEMPYNGGKTAAPWNLIQITLSPQAEGQVDTSPKPAAESKGD
jgi:hypothetical protein